VRAPASFASLKRQLGIDSSGNLDFHLKKLGELVAVRPDGLYDLRALLFRKIKTGLQALVEVDFVQERRAPGQ
jgi:hypothetical protein